MILSDADLKRLDDAYPERKGACLTCRGKGHYRWKGVETDCNCLEQRRLSTLYFHAGIGLPYQRLDWPDFTGTLPPSLQDYLIYVEEYVARGVGLYVWGEMGTGKSLLANLILKELVKRDYDCYATTFAHTIEEFTASWGDNEEKRGFARRFMHSKVLLLDDLGKEYRNKLPGPTLDNILRTRVQSSRPTIITTNLTAEEIPGFYGASVLSLLVEQSKDVPMTGVDFRPVVRTRTDDEVHAGETRPIV